METIIYLVIEVVCNLLLIYLYYLSLRKKSRLYSFIIKSIIFFMSVYLLAEIFNQIHIFLRNRHHYIELGHASILDIEIWLFFQLISIFTIIYFIFKRVR